VSNVFWLKRPSYFSRIKHYTLMLALDYARFVVIRVLRFRQKNRFASELTRILNDECKFDKYVYLHRLQILYE